MTTFYREMLATNPVAWWRLGELSGVAKDSSGNGHDGTYTNGPILGQPGLIVDTDTAVSFDGTDDHVAVAQHADLQITGALTVQAWIRQDAAAAKRIVYQGRDGGSDRLYELFVDVDGSLVFSYFNGTLNPEARSAAGVIVPGGTYHVAATRTSGMFARVYVNGAEVTSGQLSGVPVGTPTHFRIGNFGSALQFFNGTIDEVAVHNYALTPAQVAGLYDAGVNGGSIMAMSAATVTANTNHAAVERLSGWSIRESAAVAAAATVRLRKAAVGGPIVAVVELAADKSETQLVEDDWISCEGGCYVEVVAGTVEGSLYYR